MDHDTIPGAAPALTADFLHSSASLVDNLFVHGMEQGEKATAAKHDWVVFLTTDTALAPERIL